jgi:peptidoglycan/xylan/chitin deacetylase (PgdA/CDA1 family)
VKKGFLLLLISVLLLGLPPAEGAVKDKKDTSQAAGVPILLYHRFGPAVSDSMTVTTAVFESHLRYLKNNGFTVIPLSRLVGYCREKTATPLPSKAVVIVADDGHKSVYSYMFPLIKKYHVPVTLFLYPSAISNASYAMTWEQIRDLKKTGLFDLQGHTYWHPNFKIEKKRLSPAEYDKFVDMQLRKSKERLEKELGGTISMLAWPFGIYDEQLVKKAAEAGYVAAFTIERRPVRPSDKIMELPRYLMKNKDSGKAFAAIVAGASP